MYHYVIVINIGDDMIGQPNSIVIKAHSHLDLTMLSPQKAQAILWQIFAQQSLEKLGFDKFKCLIRRGVENITAMTFDSKEEAEKTYHVTKEIMGFYDSN